MLFRVAKIGPHSKGGSDGGGGGVDGGGGEVPDPPAGYTIARFTCEVRGGESECFVRHPRTLAAAPGGSVREIAKMDAG